MMLPLPASAAPRLLLCRCSIVPRCGNLVLLYGINVERDAAVVKGARQGLRGPWKSSRVAGRESARPRRCGRAPESGGGGQPPAAGSDRISASAASLTTSTAPATPAG